MLAWIIGWAVVAAANGPQELIVEGQRLSEAKQALQRELKSQGYRRLLRLGQRTWYLGPKLWKPGVMIHAEGFARVRGRPILPHAITRDPAPPHALQAIFSVQTRGTRRQQKAELVQHLEPHLRAIRDARWAMARPARDAALQKELASIWQDRTKASTARIAIVERWNRTATGRDGARMRSIIDAFVEDVVQPSEAPFTSQELARIVAQTPPDRAPPPWATSAREPTE